eukprot:Gregarina_sp_Poly_1__2869@NODE_17_length_22522_cov_92_073614_g15_i0_p2_GENE_NODE_17_length_22522_cov_92_073614_g15_i0NODE_17_length_22522_cov_92_073614_g15_i0_p2_ORF_typecomplete_len1014_score130_29Ank_5/PF13857_6/0_034Ank_5/PF13857_6/23Ank_4/PF13637_6/0_051Ank_4/PF13637_6/61Ank_2/PF12796_7/2Ank_2/PF12796_7/49_NODE_17_length_22522_cov_92_073614_g15_i0699310034
MAAADEAPILKPSRHRPPVARPSSDVSNPTARCRLAPTLQTGRRLAVTKGDSRMRSAGSADLPHIRHIPHSASAHAPHSSQPPAYASQGEPPLCIRSAEFKHAAPPFSGNHSMSTTAGASSLAATSSLAGASNPYPSQTFCSSQSSLSSQTSSSLTSSSHNSQQSFRPVPAPSSYSFMRPIGLATTRRRLPESHGDAALRNRDAVARAKERCNGARDGDCVVRGRDGDGSAFRDRDRDGAFRGRDRNGLPRGNNRLQAARPTSKLAPTMKQSGGMKQRAATLKSAPLARPLRPVRSDAAQLPPVRRSDWPQRPAAVSHRNRERVASDSHCSTPSNVPRNKRVDSDYTLYLPSIAAGSGPGVSSGSFEDHNTSALQHATNLVSQSTSNPVSQFSSSSKHTDGSLQCCGNKPKRPSNGDMWTKRARYLLDMTARRKTSILESSPSVTSPATRSDDALEDDSSPFLLKKHETTTPVPLPVPDHAGPTVREIQRELPRLENGPSAAFPPTGRDSLSALARSDSDLKDITRMMEQFVADSDEKSAKHSPLTTSTLKPPYPTPAKLKPRTPASGHAPSPLICLSLHTPPFNTASRLLVSSDAKAPIRKPISRRVLMSGILCRNVATIDSAINDLCDDPNSLVPVPIKYRHRFDSPFHNPYVSRTSALLLAVKVSSPLVVAKLIDLGAIVNTLDEYDRNALHLGFLPRPSEAKNLALQMRKGGGHSSSVVSSIIPEEAPPTNPATDTICDTSRRSSLVTPRIVSPNVYGAATINIHGTPPPFATDLLENMCDITFNDNDTHSRIIELLCLRGCDIEKCDSFGHPPTYYAKEWLSVLSQCNHNTSATPASCAARAAALTLIAFEDRLRLQLLAPLTTNLNITAYRPYKFIQLRVPPNANAPGDFVQFTPHSNAAYMDGTCDHGRFTSASGSRVTSQDTRARAGRCSDSIGKNGLNRRSHKPVQGKLKMKRKSRKSTSNEKAKFDLKNFLELVKQRSYSHPGILGIWEFLGANFQTEDNMDS